MDITYIIAFLVGFAVITCAVVVGWFVALRPIVLELKEVRVTLGKVVSYVAATASDNADTVALVKALIEKSAAPVAPVLEPSGLSVDALEIEVEQLKEALALSESKHTEFLATSAIACDGLLATNNELLEANEALLADVNEYAVRLTAALEASLDIQAPTVAPDTTDLRDAISDVLTQLNPNNTYEIGVYNGVVSLANIVLSEDAYTLLKCSPQEANVKSSGVAYAMPDRDTKGRFLKQMRM